MTASEKPSRRPVAEVGCDTCGHLACVCQIKEKHDEACPFLRAATCSVGIECEHGRDVCPQCDPCTCGHKGTEL